MGESSKHVELVQALVAWVEKHADPLELPMLLTDLPDTNINQKTYLIDGFRPDVFLKNKRCIIGEAKTKKDIETQHSREQFSSFLTYLKEIPNSILLIAVPWYLVPQAKSLIKSLQYKLDATNVATIYIEQLNG